MNYVSDLRPIGAWRTQFDLNTTCADGRATKIMWRQGWEGDAGRQQLFANKKRSKNSCRWWKEELIKKQTSLWSLMFRLMCCSCPNVTHFFHHFICLPANTWLHMNACARAHARPCQYDTSSAFQQNPASKDPLSIRYIKNCKEIQRASLSASPTLFISLFLSRSLYLFLSLSLFFFFCIFQHAKTHPERSPPACLSDSQYVAVLFYVSFASPR